MWNIFQNLLLFSMFFCFCFLNLFLKNVVCYLERGFITINVMRHGYHFICCTSIWYCCFHIINIYTVFLDDGWLTPAFISCSCFISSFPSFVMIFIVWFYFETQFCGNKILPNGFLLLLKHACCLSVLWVIIWNFKIKIVLFFYLFVHCGLSRSIR